MTEIHVQFADSSGKTIISYFGAAQDERYFPNQGTVTSDDPRWTAFYATIQVAQQTNFPSPAVN